MRDDAWTEEMFRALTTHSADIISLLDGDGRLVFNSPATLRINGFTPEELRGKDTFELIHPDDHAEVARVFGEVLAQPNALATVEYRYLTKDGRWLWMEAIASNQLENPAVRGVVANSRDISERKRLEQQLLAVQKLESLGVMAGGVAHDFNNLLAVILGEASVLRLGLPPETAAALATIESAALRARELTQQLLAYTGRQVTPVEPTDLHQLIHELTPLLRISARGGTSLQLDLAAGVPAVVCDRGQLRQVLLNLVINATEAMGGGGEVTVRLDHRHVGADELAAGPLTASFAPGPAVVLEVADAGTGMPPETVQRIFDPFFTTKQTGRGLGLAAVSGIVRSHQAGLRVESTPGLGSRFSIYLRPSPEAEAPAPARAAVRFEGTALVVDDDPLVASTVGRVLRALGFELVIAHGGREAVASFAAASRPYTVVVCDVLMPGMNGPEAVAQLRAHRPDLPVLFMSGYTPEPGLLPSGTETTGFLAKPFDADGLSTAIARLVPGSVRPGRPG
ncbi:MAG: PAS domain S-box protein [Myxococcales bacterium]|nr:PAS domain S-box protein [Myxococcales bacterium]